MKSVDSMQRAVVAWAALAAVVALSGCTSVALPEPTAARTAVAAAAAPSASVEAASRPAAISPVDAATQAEFDRALQAQRSGRNEEALSLWTAFTLAHPEIGSGHANLGLLHRQAGRDAQAVAALERAVALQPKQPRWFNELGIAYRSAGQFAKAQQAYESALAIDPRHSAALLNLAILHDLYLGNGAQALELYERYLALPPGGDTAVSKWAADLRQRKPAAGTALAASANRIAGDVKAPR